MLSKYLLDKVPRHQQDNLQEHLLDAAHTILLPGAMCGIVTAAAIFLLPASLEDHNTGCRDLSVRGKIGGTVGLIICLIIFALRERNYFNRPDIEQPRGNSGPY